MAAPSQLSSITSSLDELARRVTEVAEAEASKGDSAISRDLFAVERSLGEALRRLRRIVG